MDELDTMDTMLIHYTESFQCSQNPKYWLSIIHQTIFDRQWYFLDPKNLVVMA